MYISSVVDHVTHDSHVTQPFDTCQKRYKLVAPSINAQITAHLVDGYNAASHSNPVDGDPVPVPHFGAALQVDQFHALAARVKAAGVTFVIEPHLRFQGRCCSYWCRADRYTSTSVEHHVVTESCGVLSHGHASSCGHACGDGPRQNCPIQKEYTRVCIWAPLHMATAYT